MATGRPWRVLLVTVATLMGVATGRPLPAAQATSLIFTVTSTADTHDATPGNGVCADTNGQCTLRAAIEEANAQPSGSTIHIALPAGTYALTLGTLQLTANHITLAGVRSSTTIISGNNTSTLLSIATTVRAAITQVTLTGGNAISGNAGRGGGLFNQGVTLLSNSVVSTNTASNNGGGLANDTTGQLTLTNSTLSGNSAGFKGGGGGIDNEGTMSVTKSTLSNNSAGGTTGGGGIFNKGGTMTLSNSTLSGNFGYAGGGIANNHSGTMTVTNSTISGNGADGISNNNTLTLQATILANNTKGPNCSGVIVDRGYNLSDDISCGLTQPTDITTTTPLLGSLANNGGPTQTMALLPGSPAIDHGGTHATGCPATDQRGVTRPQGPACDIGAFELVP